MFSAVSILSHSVSTSFTFGIYYSILCFCRTVDSVQSLCLNKNSQHSTAHHTETHPKQMLKHTVYKTIFGSALPKMLKLNFITIFEPGSDGGHSITLKRSFFPGSVIDSYNYERMIFNHIFYLTGNICLVSDLGSNWDDGHLCSWVNIVVHAHVNGHILKTFVPISPYHGVRYSDTNYICIVLKP